MNAPVPGLKPTTYIGQDIPRANAKRLLAGRGQYVDIGMMDGVWPWMILLLPQYWHDE